MFVPRRVNSYIGPSGQVVVWVGVPGQGDLGIGHEVLLKFFLTFHGFNESHLLFYFFPLSYCFLCPSILLCSNVSVSLIRSVSCPCTLSALLSPGCYRQELCKLMCERLKLSTWKVQLGVLQSMNAFFQG